MKKILCFFGIHKFGDWYPVDYWDGNAVCIYEHKICERCSHSKER